MKWVEGSGRGPMGWGNRWTNAGICLGSAWLMLLVPGLGLGNDHFDAHDRDVLKSAPSATRNGNKITAKSDKIPESKLAFRSPIEGMQNTGMLVVETDQGNWAKLLVRRAARRGKKKEDLIPYLLIQRLVTYNNDQDGRIRLDKKEVAVFPGFCIDLDSGAIVPKGMGEDLEYKIENDTPVLAVVGDVKMYYIGYPLVLPPKKFKPDYEHPVRPQDFEGTYEVIADGWWKGKLTLKANENGILSGSFMTEKNTGPFKVVGKVGNPINRALFKVTFPRLEQNFEAYLWSKDRKIMTGVMAMDGRAVGFRAVRVTKKTEEASEEN